MSKIKQVEVIVKNQFLCIKAEEIGNHIWFHLNGKIFVLDKKPVRPLSVDRETGGSSGSNENLVLSPMPGRIVKVLVQIGSQVEENQTLLILSSMKMEYTIKSPVKAIIKLIKVKEEEQVNAHQELILFNSK